MIRYIVSIKYKSGDEIIYKNLHFNGMYKIGNRINRLLNLYKNKPEFMYICDSTWDVPDKRAKELGWLKW